MQMTTGRVYHSGPHTCGGVGLVRSKLAIQLSSNFIFEDGEENPPTSFNWNGNLHILNQKVISQLAGLEQQRQYSIGFIKGLLGFVHQS